MVTAVLGVIAVLAGMVSGVLSMTAGDYNKGTSPTWALPVFILSIVLVASGAMAVAFAAGEAIFT